MKSCAKPKQCFLSFPGLVSMTVGNQVVIGMVNHSTFTGPIYFVFYPLDWNIWIQNLSTQYFYLTRSENVEEIISSVSFIGAEPSYNACKFICIDDNIWAVAAGALDFQVVKICFLKQCLLHEYFEKMYRIWSSLVLRSSQWLCRVLW